MPSSLANHAYLTSDVASRLDHLAVQLQSSSTCSKVLEKMPAVFGLCGALREAKGIKARDIYHEVKDSLQELGRLLLAGKVEQVEVANEAKEKAPCGRCGLCDGPTFVVQEQVLVRVVLPC